MSFKEVEVRTFLVKKLCSRNCKGEMKTADKILMTSPPKYVHKCSICGQKENFFIKYPDIVYREV